LHEKRNEILELLKNILKTHDLLAECLLKQREIDAIDAEARLAMERSDENNLLASLDILKSIISDKSIIGCILEISENNISNNNSMIGKKKRLSSRQPSS